MRITAMTLGITLFVGSATAQIPLQPEPSLNIPRSGFGLASHEGQLYVFGGNDQSGGGPLQIGQFEVFDGTNWTLGNSFPGTPATGCAAITLDGYIYILGGFVPNGDDVNEVWRYSPATDTWVECEPMPAPRTNAGVVARDGKIYVIGGRSWEPGWVYHNTVFVYDPSLDYQGSPSSPWGTGPDHPGRADGFALGDVSAIAAEGRIHCFGGNSGTSVFSNNYDEVWIFDPCATTTAEAWTSSTPLTQARAWASAISIYGFTLVLGGWAPWNGSIYPGVADLCAYSGCPPTEHLCLPLPFVTEAAAVLEGRLYLFDGGPDGSYSFPASGAVMSLQL